MDIVMKNLGHRLEEYRSHMLKMIMGICAQSAAILDQRDKVHPKAMSSLKNIRQLAAVRLKQVDISISAVCIHSSSPYKNRMFLSTLDEFW